MKKIISVLLSAALAVSVFTFNPPRIRADNEADYEEVLTVGSSNTHLSLPPLVDGFKDGHYEIGDVIDITLQTGYTFQTEEYTMTVSDPSIVSAALLDETTLRVTCVGNGLARILVRHSLPSASGRTANIGILVGYNYPKTLLTLPLAESVGLMPEIPSSASRYYAYNKILDGIAVDGANAGVRTVSGLNDQYVIQRFDQSYLINDVQVFMSDDSSFAKPTHFSIELCDAAFPVGYAKNDKLGTQAPHAGRGDFTDYYSFDGAGATHFGGGNGTILPDFDAQIQAWPWTKIYEGAFEDYPGYIAKVEKAQILGYMAENGITGGRTGYFIKVNVLIEGEMPGSQGFMFQQIAINAQEAEAPLEQALSAAVSGGSIINIKISNTGSAIDDGFLAVGLYGENNILKDVKIIDAGQIAGESVTDQPVDISLENIRRYKVFMWSDTNEMQPLFPMYSEIVAGP